MTTTSLPTDDGSLRRTEGARSPIGRHARPSEGLLPPTTTRVPALDGLRAVAVVLVVVYHVAPAWMPAGFLGVTLFFTLSGFLITRLLVAERTDTGAIALKAFWVRRFRRLLPAALVTLGVVTVVWVASGWMTRAIGGDVVASLAEVANWRFLVSGTAYGATIDASPVLHFWSLAIEEQFYLAFPLLVWLVARRAARPVRTVGGLVGVLLAASLVATWWWRAEPLTVYFSTFTRAAEVLLGAALAVVTWSAVRPRRSWVLGLAGALATVAIGVVAIRSRLSDPIWSEGGLAAVGALSALAVLGATQSGPFQQVLSTRPLVRLGELSYAVYLFHWPILVALRTTGLSPWVIGIITVTASVGLALVSLRYLEHPVRAGRWRRIHPVRWVVPLMAAVAVVALWGGSRSTQPTFDFTGERGVTDLAVAPIPTTTPTTTPAPGGESAGAAPTGATVAPGPLPVSVFGDSTAIQLRLGLTDADPRIEVRPGWSEFGCTVTRSGDVRGDYTSDDGKVEPMGRCDWTDAWPDTVRATGSTTAIVYSGYGDTLARRLPGAWEGWKTLEDSVVVDNLRSEMVALTDALHAAGARTVVWLTLAPNTRVVSAQNTRRVDTFNQVLREAADQRPDVAVPVDLAGWFATQPSSLRPDGVHVTRDTGRTVTEGFLADELLRASGR